MLDRKIAVAVCAPTVGFAMSSMNSFANGTQAVVTTSTLNIRSGPSTTYSVLTKVYKGNVVEILSSSNGWYKVKLSNGQIGWGSATYISISNNHELTNSDNEVSTGKMGTVTTSTLNIRSGPSTSYSVITTAYKGNVVEILSSSNGWYKVKLSNGKIGWGSATYISTSNTSGSGTSGSGTSSSEVSTGKMGTVTTSTLNIRSGPSTSYSVITTAYKGNVVEILSSSNGWYKVKLSNGKIGWGSSAYISTSNTSGQESIVQDKTQAVVSCAKAQLGKPYVWGAEGPNSFDCSGLTYYVYKQSGITLPRVSSSQAGVGTSVGFSNLKPGDLLFSSTDGSGRVTHVGIYIGNGEMVHAPKPGDVVQKANVNTTYWQKAFVGAKRVL